MTHDATDSRPLDLRDLQEADGLGRAWDAWLRDDLEPTRHAASDSLAAGLAATVENLYAKDDTPGPSTTFRHSLKRDLLHVHDALRLQPAAAPNGGDFAPAALLPAAPIPAPHDATRRWRKRPSRPSRRWWPAVEFAAATIVIAALFGITFGNARIAEYFRDDGNYASDGETTSTPVTLEQGWTTELRDVLGVNERPEHVVVTDRFVAVVSSDFESRSVTLTLFDAATGNRLWAALVNDYMDGGGSPAPVIDDGKVYFVNGAAVLYVIDIATYDDPGSLYATKLPFDATYSSPVVLDGVVYAAGGVMNGEMTRLPDLAELDGVLFIVGDSTAGLVGIDPSNDTYVLEWNPLPVQIAPGVTGLWRIDPANQTILNSAQESDMRFRYVTALESGLLAVSGTTTQGRPIGVAFLDPEDLTEVYTFEPPDGLWEGAVDTAGERVIVMASDPGNTVAMTVIDPLHPGAEVQLPWNYLNAPSKPDPTIDGSSTIIVSDDDVIRVYDPQTGAVLEETPIGASMGEINAMDTDGDAIVVAFEDGTLMQLIQVPADAPPLPAPATPPTPMATMPSTQTPTNP